MIRLVGLMLLAFKCHALLAAPLTEGARLAKEAAAFNKEFGIKVSNISIKPVSKEDAQGAAGICYPKSNYILINIDFWKTLGPYQRRWLIWHELLHCQFHIDHVTATFDNGTPQSIMYPYMLPYFTEQFLRSNWTYYAKQAHSMIGNPAFLFKDED